MKSIITSEAVYAIVKGFASKQNRFILREDDYTHRLATELSEHFCIMSLTAIGGFVDSLRDKWESRSLALQKQYLPKAKDLYPDITLLEPVFGSYPLDLTRFENFEQKTQVFAIFECKYSPSFPSVSIKHFVHDAVKLQLLGDYCMQRFGHMPLLFQLIFDLDGHYAHKSFRLKFADKAFRAQIPAVQVVVINSSSICEVI